MKNYYYTETTEKDENFTKSISRSVSFSHETKSYEKNNKIYENEPVRNIVAEARELVSTLKDVIEDYSFRSVGSLFYITPEAIIFGHYANHYENFLPIIEKIALCGDKIPHQALVDLVNYHPEPPIFHDAEYNNLRKVSKTYIPDLITQFIDKFSDEILREIKEQTLTTKQRKEEAHPRINNKDSSVRGR